MLKDKKVFVYGETNDLFDTILEDLITVAGGETVNSATDCFSWGTGESVSVAEQALAKEMAKTHGAENVIVVVGFTNVWTLKEGRIGEVLARTFWEGDPGGAGPLKKSDPPKIKTYSIFEFEDEIPEEVWKKHKMHRKKREVGKEALDAFIDRLKELRGD